MKKHHYGIKKYHYGIKINDQQEFEAAKSINKLYVVHWAMAHFYSLIADGDNENEGKGSLWNCAPDIFKFLWENGEYSYADVSVKIYEEED